MAKQRVTEKMSQDESIFLMALRMVNIQLPGENTKIAFRIAKLVIEKGKDIQMIEIAEIAKTVWDELKVRNHESPTQ